MIPHLDCDVFYNTRYSPSNDADVSMEYTLTEKDALTLRLLIPFFENQRMIFYRDTQGKLFACKDSTCKGVQINRDLLSFIPRGKWIDLRDTARRNQQEAKNHGG